LIVPRLELQMLKVRKPLCAVISLAVVAGCTSPAVPTPPASATPPVGVATDGWIDVSATLAPGRTPVYEGDAPMVFTFLKDMRKGDPLTLSKYDMGAHSGTHIDAPMHFIRDGASIDQVQLASLIGPARVIEIPDSVQAITAAELNRHDWKGAARLLFRTRSTSKGWMDSAQFHRDFAYIAADAADVLAQAGVVLVGVDYISAEQFGAPAPRAHQILLGRGIPIVEGLDLHNAPAGEYDLIVLPLKVAGHEGAPARAIVRSIVQMSLPRVQVQAPVRQLGGAP
jgi:arylformamidase